MVNLICDKHVLTNNKHSYFDSLLASLVTFFLITIIYLFYFKGADC